MGLHSFYVGGSPMALSPALRLLCVVPCVYWYQHMYVSCMHASRKIAKRIFCLSELFD